MTTKYIRFEGGIEKDTVDTLIEDCSNALDEGRDIRLYINSWGGDCEAGDILCDFLLEYQNEIVVVPYGHIYSRAANLIYFELPLCMIDGFDKVECVMFHPIDRLSESIRKGNDVPNKMLVEHDKRTNESIVDYWLSDVLLDKHIKKYENGEDVYLMNDELVYFHDKILEEWEILDY